MTGFEAHHDSTPEDLLRRLERLGATVTRAGQHPQDGIAVEVELTRACPRPDEVFVELQRLARDFRLTLRNCRATDAGIRRLASAPRLRAIRLIGESRLTPQCLQYLPMQVEQLALGGGPINDDWLVAVGKLTRLIQLDLSNSRISDRGLKPLARLEQLRQLAMRNTDISDKGLKPLARIKPLRSLYLEGTYVTPQGIQWLRQQLPELEQVTP